MAHRRLFLSKGRAVARLEHQPAHASFAIDTSAGSVRAVGTVFAVIVGESIELHAVEGTVAVETTRGEEAFTAPGAMNLRSGERTLLSSAAAESDRRLLTGTIQAVPDARELPAASPPQNVAVPVISASSPAPVPSLPQRDVDSRDSIDSGASGESVDQLLLRARSARAASRFQEAAAAYEALERAYPTDPAARAALVSLGNLQLVQLKDPRAALGSFDAYLKTADPTLRPEALAGRIRALRDLGRGAEEKSAIGEFLRLHPDDLRAPSLRSRLIELDSVDADSK
jgi:tetratricopeptide (TPR) repeat protein